MGLGGWLGGRVDADVLGLFIRQHIRLSDLLDLHNRLVAVIWHWPMNDSNAAISAYYFEIHERMVEAALRSFALGIPRIDSNVSRAQCGE